MDKTTNKPVTAVKIMQVIVVKANQPAAYIGPGADYDTKPVIFVYSTDGTLLGELVNVAP